METEGLHLDCVHATTWRSCNWLYWQCNEANVHWLPRLGSGACEARVFVHSTPAHPALLLCVTSCNAQTRPLNPRERDEGHRQCVAFDDETRQVVLTVSACLQLRLQFSNCKGAACGPHECSSLDVWILDCWCRVRCPLRLCLTRTKEDRCYRTVRKPLRVPQPCKHMPTGSL